MPRFVIILSFALMSFVLGSCQHGNRGDLVAEVYGHKLFLSDIEGLVPDGATADDSIAVVQAFVNQWIDQMVLLHKAEKNIKDDFQQQIDNYRNNLITYAYEQQITSQNVDTVVSDKEIATYYDEHLDDFVLISPIVRCLYLRVPLDDANLPKIERMLKNGNLGEDNIIDLQHLAAGHTTEMSFDIDQWVYLNQLHGRIPNAAYSDPNYYRSRHFTSLEDSLTTSLVYVFESRLANDYAPLDLQRDNIKTAIINRRKVDFILRMRQDLRREAEVDGKVYIRGEHIN